MRALHVARQLPTHHLRTHARAPPPPPPQRKTHTHTHTQTHTHTPQTKEGGLAPTKKGVSLGLEEWATLRGLLPQLAAAMAGGSEGFDAPLKGSVRATTSTFQ
jgi:hypothetical protein